jgi:threonine/homoserine/homoserine lactone efflux protein
VTGAFVAGAAAGYAIAIPVGAIAVLILDLGIRRGLRTAGAAATGAASADGVYALVAMLFGTALATVIEPLSRPLRIVAVVILVAIAIRGLASVRAGARAARVDSVASSPLRTYAQLLALTLLNPATVIYFAALILGLPDIGDGLAERLAFVAGAFLSSLSWQWLLAVVGAVGHRRLSPRFQAATSVVGNLVILGFAALIAAGLLAPA